MANGYTYSNPQGDIPSLSQIAPQSASPQSWQYGVVGYHDKTSPALGSNFPSHLQNSQPIFGYEQKPVFTPGMTASERSLNNPGHARPEYAYIAGILDQGRQLDAAYGGLQEQAFRGQFNAIRGGAARARAAISRIGAAGYQRARDAADRARGAMQANLTNRGLGGTSLSAQVEPQVGGMEIRAMQETDAHVGQLYAGLEYDLGRDEARTYDQYAQFLGQRARSQNEFLLEEFYWRTGRYNQSRPSSGDGGKGALYQALGGAVGAFAASL